MERGERNGAGNIGGDRGDEVLFLGEELGQDFFTFLELRGLARVHHVVDIGVDLAALDAVQVVADGHIEHEPVGIAEAVDLAHDLERAPSLDVLVLRLLHGQLGRPLLVVALVSGEDTGAGNTGGKLRAVHFLHGLDLEKARAGGIGRDDILRKLAVGAGGGAKRCFDALAKDRQALAACVIVLMNAEHIAALRVFARHPVHQRVERNGIHFFRHKGVLLSFECRKGGGKSGGAGLRWAADTAAGSQRGHSLCKRECPLEPQERIMGVRG